MADNTLGFYETNDLRNAAKKRLPKGLFEFMDRGNDDEVAMRDNRAVLERIKLGFDEEGFTFPYPSRDVYVHQSIAAASKAVGHEISTQISGRRAGDPAILIADISKAKEYLGWQPKLSLDQMVKDAWESMK